MSETVSVVSLKALQPIAKTTYTVDGVEAKALTRRILWKLDTRYFEITNSTNYLLLMTFGRVLPPITILYLCNFFDRSNVGNTKIIGLETDLHLTNHQYAIALSVFYVFYVVADVPSNLFLKKATSRLWLSLLAILWGISVMCVGFVRNFAGFVAVRCLLGIFEGGVGESEYHAPDK